MKLALREARQRSTSRGKGREKTTTLLRQPASPSFDLAGLRTGLRPYRLHWFSRLRSTNDHAAVLRRRGELFMPAVVLTGRQTAGRGRGANVWWSGGGSLTVTFALPIDEQVAPHQLPLVAGLAVRNAIAALPGAADVRLKWPNDILFEDRKLGGLLCERISGADLIGVGLNVNFPAAAVPRVPGAWPVWLSEIIGGTVNPNELLIRVAASVRGTIARAASHPFAEFLREYDRHHALVGRDVTVTDGPEGETVSGACRGLDHMGRLLLDDGKSVHHLIAGHVLLR